MKKGVVVIKKILASKVLGVFIIMFACGSDRLSPFVTILIILGYIIFYDEAEEYEKLKKEFKKT
jgi:hypothetical protein